MKYLLLTNLLFWFLATCLYAQTKAELEEKRNARVFYGAQNGKREIFIRLTGAVRTYTISLRGTSITSGRFDATINPSQEWSAANVTLFLDHVAPGNIRSEERRVGKE